MRTSNWILFGVLFVSLVAFGCVQQQPQGTPTPTTTTTSTIGPTSTTQSVSGEVAAEQALEEALGEATEPDVSGLDQELTQ